MNLTQLQRRQPVQNRAEKTRNKVMVAAVEVLSVQGIGAFSIRQVAKSAGISIGTIYEYYPSKQALLFWVVEQRFNRRLKVFDSILTKENMDKSLKHVIDCYLTALREADLYSRLDLEVRTAEDRDDGLRKHTARYKEELTKRYIKIWKHFGSKQKIGRLKLIANYSHELDLASMRLQLSEKKSSAIEIRFITQQLAHVLAGLALQPDGSWNQDFNVKEENNGRSRQCSGH